MKEAGFNAIRSAHNPISKAMLNACDELGMYIMDEAFDNWMKNPGTYGHVLYFAEEWEKDLRDMVLKDLNHPSVIMYSTGNEITDTAFPDGIEWAEKMTKLCHELDDSRPVTCCINLFLNVLAQKGGAPKIAENKKNKEDITDPLAEDTDSQMGGSMFINLLVATGPFLQKLLMTPKASDKATSRAYPSKISLAITTDIPYIGNITNFIQTRVMVGSETNVTQSAKNWEQVKTNPHVIGDFIWTAWDYMGECGVGVIDYNQKTGVYTKPYPVIVAGCGAIDLTGFKDTYAYLTAIVRDQI